MTQKPQEVVKANTAAAFDAFYSFNDYLATTYLNQERLELYELAVDRCEEFLAPDPLSVVDVGCGLGHTLLAIQRRVAPREVALTGLDFSAVALEKARAILPTARLVHGDLYASPLPTGTYDLVLCVETLEHLHDPLAALRELLRVCRPGGGLVLTVPNGEKDSWTGHRSFWTPRQFAEFLRPWGLADMALLQRDTVLLAKLRKTDVP